MKRIKKGQITLQLDMEGRLFGDKTQATPARVAKKLKGFWLAWVIGRVDLEFVLLLREETGVSPSDFSQSQMTPLHAAADAANADIIRELEDWGFDYEAYDYQGFSPLHHAVMRGSEECVKKLLERGASPNRPTRDGVTPLFMAVDGSRSIVRRLLREGADPNVLVDGLSPLHRAAARGTQSVAFALLSGEADPNMRGTRKLAPLHLAVLRNHPGIASLLLSTGAKKSVQTEDGRTPLQIAKQKNHDAVIRVIRDA